MTKDAPARPFCTARCKWVDLGRWFDGTYAVPSEDPDDLYSALSALPPPMEGDDA